MTAPKTRPVFFLLRVALSAVLLGLVTTFIRVAWFPGLYFELSGLARQLAVLAIVIFLIGAVLSTFFYRPENSGNRFDMAVLFLLEIAAMGVVTRDIAERRPELRHPCNTAVEAVRQAGHPLKQLLSGDDEGKVLDWIEGNGGGVEEFAYLPLRGRVADAIMIVDALTAYPVAMPDIDPWQDD